MTNCCQRPSHQLGSDGQAGAVLPGQFNLDSFGALDRLQGPGQVLRSHLQTNLIVLRGHTLHLVLVEEVGLQRRRAHNTIRHHLKLTGQFSVDSLSFYLLRGGRRDGPRTDRLRLLDIKGINKSESKHFNKILRYYYFHYSKSWLARVTLSFTWDTFKWDISTFTALPVTDLYSGQLNRKSYLWQLTPHADPAVGHFTRQDEEQVVRSQSQDARLRQLGDGGDDSWWGGGRQKLITWRRAPSVHRWDKPHSVTPFV